MVPMGLVLVVTMPTGGKELELAPGRFTIGRASSGNVVIEHASVSRAHAEIVVTAERAIVRDLGSRNGTSVNGQKVGDDGVELCDGDEVTFGEVVGYVKARVSAVGAAARLLSPHDFEQRLATETDRCVRENLSLTVFALQAFSTRPGKDVGQIVASMLRGKDAARVQPSGRIDVLAPECDRDRATMLAVRLVESLGVEGVNVRIGLATFPGDVPSASSLCAAAEATLAEVTLGGYGSAKWEARKINIGSREIVLVEASMVRLFGVIERLSTSSAPVLVRGETGSGKEIIAEAIHALSARAARPLVRINCAAMSPALVESELFGHVRGAFSGADRDKVGLFEEADGGTLFLDEIGEFELPLQAKLLRVLEDHRIRRVGASTETAVDVRIIAATHRDLKVAALEGRFREDLYYRLSAMVLEVPPLRERPREIVVLAERFVAEISRGFGRAAPRIGARAVAMLKGHAWPGNVRELRNVIQRAVVACEGDEVRPEHLDLPTPAARTPTVTPPAITASVDETRPLDLDGNLREVERKTIIDALEQCGGNQTRAAELLGMPRRTLVYKLRALGIPRAPRV
jgi:two-component system response regulator AtoC